MNVKTKQNNKNRNKAENGSWKKRGKAKSAAGGSHPADVPIGSKVKLTLGSVRCALRSARQLGKAREAREGKEKMSSSMLGFVAAFGVGQVLSRKNRYASRKIYIQQYENDVEFSREQ